VRIIGIVVSALAILLSVLVDEWAWLLSCD